MEESNMGGRGAGTGRLGGVVTSFSEVSISSQADAKTKASSIISKLGENQSVTVTPNGRSPLTITRQSNGNYTIQLSESRSNKGLKKKDVVNSLGLKLTGQDLTKAKVIYRKG